MLRDMKENKKFNIQKTEFSDGETIEKREKKVLNFLELIKYKDSEL